MGFRNQGMPEQPVIGSQMVQATGNYTNYILSQEVGSTVCCGRRCPTEKTGLITFVKVPVPRQKFRNEAECSATLYVGNVKIDTHPSCGREQLEALLEMLHTC